MLEFRRYALDFSEIFDTTKMYVYIKSEKISYPNIEDSSMCHKPGQCHKPGHFG